MTGQIPVGFLSFASPWMLFAATSIAIPLLMHLIRRRYPRTISWAAMEILQDVLREQQQRVRTEQWLLLMLRIAALLLLSLAVARPYWSPTSNASALDTIASPLLHIIAIDNSLSMSVQDSDQTVFDRAKKLALDLIQKSSSNDSFSVITFGQATSVIGSPSSSRELVAAVIDKLQPTDTGSDLESAARTIASLAKSAGEQGFPKDRIRTHIFTDMGSDSLRFATDKLHLDEVVDLLKETNATIHNIGSPDTSNLAVTDVKHQATDYLVAVPIDLSTTIRSYDLQKRTTRVQVFANDQLLDSKTIELEPESESSVSFQFTPKEPIVHKLKVQIEDNRLPRDNQRFFAVHVQSQRRMLFVHRSPNAISFSERAITAGREAMNGVTVSRIAPHELSLQDLPAYQFIVLEDINWNDNDLVRRLTDYATAGGNIVCLLGSNSMFYPTKLSQSSPASRLLGLSIDERIACKEWSISPLDYRSPIIQPFERFPQSGLLTLPIFRTWKVTVTDGTAIVDLALVNTANPQEMIPLLVRHRVGLGQVATWLSAPEDGRTQSDEQSWNAIAAWPAFVPLWQNLVSVMSGQNAHTLAIQTGTPLHGPIPIPTDTQLSIATPMGIQSPSIKANQQTTGAEWFFDNTGSQGFYELKQDGIVMQTFAANVDTIESSLQSFPASGTALAELMTQRSFNQVASQADTNATSHVSCERENHFSNGLLIALIICLISESIVACIFGRRLA